MSRPPLRCRVWRRPRGRLQRPHAPGRSRILSQMGPAMQEDTPSGCSQPPAPGGPRLPATPATPRKTSIPRRGAVESESRNKHRKHPAASRTLDPQGGGRCSPECRPPGEARGRAPHRLAVGDRRPADAFRPANGATGGRGVEQRPDEPGAVDKVSPVRGPRRTALAGASPQLGDEKALRLAARLAARGPSWRSASQRGDRFRPMRM